MAMTYLPRTGMVSYSGGLPMNTLSIWNRNLSFPQSSCSRMGLLSPDKETLRQSPVFRPRKKSEQQNVKQTTKFNNSLPKEPDLDDVFLSDLDSDEEFRSSDSSPADTGERSDGRYSVKVYKKACQNMKLVPETAVIKGLVTDSITARNSVLGRDAAKACAIALVGNTRVKTLDLKGANIGDKGTQYICEMLLENCFISSVGLGGNNITSRGLNTLVKYLKGNFYISKLDLSDNNIGDYEAYYIVELLETLQVLRELILSHNRLNVVGGQVLGAGLAKTDHLEVLDLSWNHLRREGAEAIAEGVRKSSSLLEVNLAWNGFHVEGCQALSRCLEENKTLESLDLTCNRINRESLGHIMKGLKNNKSLRSLKLGSNSLSSDGSKDLLQLLYDNPSIPLEVLDLSDQCVDKDFVSLLENLQSSREPPLQCVYGKVFGQDEPAFVEDDLFTAQPMMVLMEFMRQRNMRLVDLFQSLDADGSQSLTHQEFRDGLLGVNIPLSVSALEKLIKLLDKDGDGEVDFKELMDGQKSHRRKLTLILKNDPSPEAANFKKIQEKIARLLKRRPEATVKKIRAVGALLNARGKSSALTLDQMPRSAPSSAKGRRNVDPKSIYHNTSKDTSVITHLEVKDMRKEWARSGSPTQGSSFPNLLNVWKRPDRLELPSIVNAL